MSLILECTSIVKKDFFACDSNGVYIFYLEVGTELNLLR